MKASYSRISLQFKTPGGTSRGVLTSKNSWFLKLENNGKIGIGECSTIAGLSPDLDYNLDEAVKNLVDLINLNGLTACYSYDFTGMPALRFCIEMAKMGLASVTPHNLYESNILATDGIPINGLIWMGEIEFMKQQIRSKIEAGFDCIKIKVAALDFEDECSLLKSIRKEYTDKDIKLRVDANGGFTKEEALEKLKRLSDYKLHSIEQPIKPRQFQAMTDLCSSSPIPIALDEELIGIENEDEKRALLKAIQPQYLILKPSLLGGVNSSEEWIKIADSQNIGWWVTSALESNIGLNAIAQWTSTLKSSMHQGLGTGQLFTNNIPSPLFIKSGRLFSDPSCRWDNRNLQPWLS